MRIAVISDVHSNLRALEAVLAAIDTVDACWHLGDAVGYGPDPDAVVARLRGLGAVSVRGNHDDAVAGGECVRWFVSDARAAAEWTRSVISPQTRAWLEALPLQVVTETPAGSFTLVHGSPRDPLREYVYSRAVAREILGDVATEHCLVGHTHVPLHFQTIGAGPQPRRRAARAQEEAQGFQKDGLARTRLAGEGGEAGRELDFHAFDDREIDDLQAPQHSRASAVPI